MHLQGNKSQKPFKIKQGGSGRARPGAGESSKQCYQVTDWQDDGGRSQRPQGARTPGERCGPGPVQGEHRSESDS